MYRFLHLCRDAFENTDRRWYLRRLKIPNDRSARRILESVEGLNSSLALLWFLRLCIKSAGLINVRRNLGAPDSLSHNTGRSSQGGVKGRPFLSSSLESILSLVVISTSVLQSLTVVLDSLPAADMVTRKQVGSEVVM